MRGDPLCVGCLTFYFGWVEQAEPAGEAPGGPMVALLESPDATAWKRLVPADDPEFYRGPSVADEADARLYGQRVPLPGVTYQ